MDTVKLLNSRMIKSFRDKATSDLFHGIALRGTIVSIKQQNQEDPAPNPLIRHL